MAGVTWEGRFGWQAYVLAGRPDLLNYVQHGDVTWEQVWDFCHGQRVGPDVLVRMTRLFHGYLSAIYDREGCWLDPEGEIAEELRAWASFAISAGESFPEEQVLSILAHLLDLGVVSRLYYEAAFAVYAEIVLDGYASRWTRDREAVLALAEANGASTSTATPTGTRPLPAYEPAPERFAALSGDAEWERCCERLMRRHYCSWNEVYVSMADDDDLEESLQDHGGEGGA